MAQGSGPGADALRLWLEAQAEALSGAARSAGWDRAEELFRAWCRLLEGFGPTAASTAAPFDPSEWLKPADSAGMGLLAGWLGGGAGAGRANGEPAVEWRDYLAALERHRAITGAAWLAAFRAFAEEARRAFDDARRHEKPAPGLPELEALWRGIADREFAATQSSMPFLEGQEALLAAALDLRIRLRRDVEAVADLLGLPTRAEVDDMAEAIHQLRREVRALKRGDRE